MSWKRLYGKLQNWTEWCRYDCSDHRNPCIFNLGFPDINARPLFLYNPMGRIVLYIWNLNCLFKGKGRGSGKHRSSNMLCLCKSSSVAKAIASGFCLPTTDHTEAAQVPWSSLGNWFLVVEIKYYFCYGWGRQRDVWYLPCPKHTAEQAYGLHSHERRGSYKGVLHGALKGRYVSEIKIEIHLKQEGISDYFLWGLQL